MGRLVLAAWAGCVLTCGAAVGDPIFHIDVPVGYTPGGTFDVTVELSGAVGLALYNIELELSSTGGTAGTDFYFIGSAEPASRYVFDGTANDGFAFNILDSAPERITLSDLLTTGSVSTLAGINDLVADVTIGTSTAMVDDVTVAVVAASLELDGESGPIPGYDALKADPPSSSIPIPEPATLALLVGGVWWVKRRASRRPQIDGE